MAEDPLSSFPEMAADDYFKKLGVGAAFQTLGWLEDLQRKMDPFKGLFDRLRDYESGISQFRAIQIDFETSAERLAKQLGDLSHHTSGERLAKQLGDFSHVFPTSVASSLQTQFESLNSLARLPGFDLGLASLGHSYHAKLEA